MSKSFSRVLIKDKNHRLLMVQDRKGEWNFPGGKLEKVNRFFNVRLEK